MPLSEIYEVVTSDCGRVQWLAPRLRIDYVDNRAAGDTIREIRPRNRADSCAEAARPRSGTNDT
jgi:hypothetical protein